MPNQFYDHTSYPANGAPLSSSAMRAELDAIEDGFDKMPTLTGNGAKLVRVNVGGTALEAVDPANYVTDVAAVTHAATSKTTPVDADALPLVDSAASNTLKKLTWANLRTTMATALASTFAAIAGSVSQAFSAASIELGHASDTTLTRVSAGVLGVEGKTVATLSTAQNWTDIQRADYTTAAVSTTSNYTFAGADQVVNITLTNAITVTFVAPSGLVAGAYYTFILTAGDTAARTFAWNAAWKFPGAAVKLAAGTATSGAVDVITFVALTATTAAYVGHSADLR